MIPFSDSLQHSKNKTTSWQQEILNSFKDLGQLLDYLEIDPSQRSHYQVSESFPLKVTHFYASLIKKNTPNDPLLLQVIPQQLEQKQYPDYQADAVGDLQATQHPGLIHKYQGRALITLTAACAIHCRYCFRREFPYSNNLPDLGKGSVIDQYFHQHKDIHEVILSGGDPLMFNDEKLTTLIEQFEQIEHLKTIRIHTRLISVLPSRVSEKLIQLLSQCSKNVVIVTHINHPNEINDDVQQALKSLQQCGITLFNQSVLLNKVNNNSDLLKQLSLTLFDAGVTPYYLHCLDKVTGTAHFDSPRDEAKQIIKKLTEQLPGYLVPTLVEEIAGESSKTHII